MTAVKVNKMAKKLGLHSFGFSVEPKLKPVPAEDVDTSLKRKQSPATIEEQIAQKSQKRRESITLTTDPKQEVKRALENVRAEDELDDAVYEVLTEAEIGNCRQMVNPLLGKWKKFRKNKNMIVTTTIDSFSYK